MYDLFPLTMLLLLMENINVPASTLFTLRIFLLFEFHTVFVYVVDVVDVCRDESTTF